MKKRIFFSLKCPLRYKGEGLKALADMSVKNVFLVDGSHNWCHTNSVVKIRNSFWPSRRKKFQIDKFPKCIKQCYLREGVNKKHLKRRGPPSTTIFKNRKKVSLIIPYLCNNIYIYAYFVLYTCVISIIQILS